jgi:polygalacturonase
MRFLNRSLQLAPLAALLFVLAPAFPASHSFNVRDQGAAGDGTALDTAAINRAIAACADAGGGEVRFPAGRYLSGTIRLRSRVTLNFEAGARLIGTTNLNEYQQPSVPAFLPEAKWGKWHRALIVGENLEDVTVTGGGVIDGNKVFDPAGEEHMRGPHTIAFVNCRRFTIRDVSIVDAANYAVFFQTSDDVEVRNVKITGGWDGVHWRGAPERWCTNVTITGCQFFTGDDSIAGRYWENTLVSDCIVNSSCNGIRLIGPAVHLLVNDCLFYGPGREPHRTSGAQRRTNMLAAINLQPGGWDPTRGPVDDVLISNNTMRNVAAPVMLTVKGANTVGRVTVSGLNATGVYRAALSAESWSDAPVTNFVVRNANLEFDGGGTAEQGKAIVKSPGVDARALPAWGFYARNVDNVTFEDVRFSLSKDDFRPALLVEKAKQVTLDNFKFPHVEGVASPLIVTNVGKLNVRPHPSP